MLRKIIKNLYFRYFIFFILLSFIFYIKSFGGYFQGDEWFYFSQFLPLTHTAWGFMEAIKKSLFSSNEISGGGHLTPIYTLIWWIHNKLFGLNFFPYIFLSVFIHGINSFLVFLFTKKLTKNSHIAILAGIFFAVSFPHFQAITWIMAYIPTVYSTLFVLLSMYFIAKTIDSKKDWDDRSLILSNLFFILALLTKESSIILFAVLPIIVFLFNRPYSNKYIRTYLPILIGYGTFRLGLPILMSSAKLSNVNKLFVPNLFIFRTITYPLRQIVQVFIPQPTILSITEFLTPLAYPIYSADHAIRGSNFLAFTQSAGSDLIIYPLSTLFLALYLFCLAKLKKPTPLKSTFLLGGLIIISSALPLVFIALYAPWWGYVTFIDSRHLYISSIGGGIIFGTLIFKLYNYFKKVALKILIYILLILWGYSQYNLLQNQLIIEAQTGFQRKKIINAIKDTVPVLSKSTVLFVKSDVGYYGFNAIPPFQTSLGQILTINYYDKNQLSRSFLADKYLSQKGVLSQGYRVKEGKGFGFYTDETKLSEAYVAGSFKKENVHAFEWKGKSEDITDISDTVRTELENRYTIIKSTKYWKKYISKENHFSFKYPPDMNILNETGEISGQIILMPMNGSYPEIQSVTVLFKRKPKEVFFHEYVPQLLDGDGNKIGEKSKITTIQRIDNSKMTFMQTTSGDSPKYLLPIYDGGSYIDITIDYYQKSESNSELLEDQLSFPSLLLKTVLF